MAVARPPRWLRALVLLTLLAGVTAITLFAAEGAIATVLATFLVNVLLVGALATAVALVYIYGFRPWTVFTAGITLLGALVQVGVILVGLPGVGGLVPALAWGGGLLAVLFVFSTSGHGDREGT